MLVPSQRQPAQIESREILVHYEVGLNMHAPAARSQILRPQDLRFLTSTRALLVRFHAGS
jgi:hypothetical protein